MQILRNISPYFVLSGESILDALNKANSNVSRMVFVVDDNGTLEGVLTDGDLRRWLTSASNIDFTLPVSHVMNVNFVSGKLSQDKNELYEIFEPKYKALPLVDEKFRLSAIAFHNLNEYEIGGKFLSADSSAFIIAEIGNNHNGSLDLAFKLVDEAHKSGADCIKFQMRDMNSLYGNMAESDKENADLGTQYTLELLSKFQLSDKDLFTVFDYVKEKGSIPLCTPWDIPSLEKLEGYGMEAYKVASADFTNYDLIEEIASKGKLMICSTGMSSESEIREGINFIKKLGCPFALLHCNSTYPAPFKDINLNYIPHLHNLSKGLVGYSGHERDINVPIAAIGLGAKIIEKHFTLDKSMEGNDHKVSLLPEEFTRMVEGIRQVEESLGNNNERTLSQGEMMNRENLAKSLIAKTDIPSGNIITQDMIEIMSPGQGLQPNRIKELIGRPLNVSKKKGEFFFENDLNDQATEPRDYDFKREWGIPVRYHDLQHMKAMSNMTLLEIHLSYTDMELDFKKFIPEPIDKRLVVHAPELFKGDHTLDLCSKDKIYRSKSIDFMQETIDLSRELKKHFNESNVLIVTNVGGFSHEAHLDKENHQELYDILIQSLQALDTDGVEIIPQTMPPFPWHFGGQQFHNLFVDSASIKKFCQENDMRICLDASHSQLACNFNKESFIDFTREVSPYIAHMHLADASGVDGEGLQIDEGDINWAKFSSVIAKHAPTATFIPEIWQGHKNEGEGAWKALDRLSHYLD